MGTLQLVFGLGLLAQVGAAPPAVQTPPAAAAPAVAAPPGPGSPPVLLTSALTPPARSPLVGQPVTVVDLLARQSDRARQLQAVRAYWELSAAVAGYYLCRQDFDYLTRLEGFETTGPATTDGIDGAMATMEADSREAELKAIEKQYALAPWLATQVVTALPLPADMPHVGQYRTYFEQLFAGRPAPEAAKRANETMPVRYKEVELRAAAVQAAVDVLNATEEAYTAGRAPREAVVERLQEASRQKQAFVAAVLAYNLDVCEYALAVARRGASAAEISAMLVPRMPAAPAAAAPAAAAPIAPTTTQPAQPGAGAAPNPTSRRMPPGSRATYEEPLLGVPPTGNAPAEFQQPVEDAGGGWQPHDGEPTPAEPTPAEPEAPASPGEIPFDPGNFGPIEEAPAEVPPAAPGEEAEPAPPFDTTSSSSALRHNVARPVIHVARQATAANAAAVPLHDQLPADNPRQRAQELGALLATTGATPASPGIPLTLDECLAAVSSRDRAPVTSAYWAARGCATRYAVLARQVEQLAALQKPTLTAMSSSPNGALSMMELRAARLAADADLTRAEAELMVAEYLLPTRTTATGAMRSLPVTAPHGGRYAMRLEAFPPDVQSSATVVRLAAAMPRWHAAVVARSDAVVDADKRRAARIGDYLRAPGDLAPVIAAVQHQTEASLAFADTLTDYNKAIGEYAATVLPANLPAPQYVATLVLQQPAVAGRL